MIKDYLNALKNKGKFSWNDLANLSGLPDATIRKIFSGETADPRLETVAKLVSAMGGSLDELVGREKKSEVELNAVMSMKEVYEARIADIKASYDVHLETLRRDRRYLAIAVCLLGACVLLLLVIDLLIGGSGWIRY